MLQPKSLPVLRCMHWNIRWMRLQGELLTATRMSMCCGRSTTVPLTFSR